jgi:hypothetical protein
MSSSPPMLVLLRLLTEILRGIDIADESPGLDRLSLVKKHCSILEHCPAHLKPEHYVRIQKFHPSAIHTNFNRLN